MPVCLVHGVRIHYTVVGTGTPILFVAPPVVGNSVFLHQVNALLPGHQVILFDLRGHGKSDPSDTQLSYSVVAEDIRCILDQLQLPATFLCGYSMGSSIALEFVRMYPERVKGAILVSGFSEVSDWRLRTEISTAIQLAKIRAFRTMAAGLALANADGYSSFRKMFKYGLKARQKDVQSLFEHALVYNCTAALPQMKSPIRLIFGAKDRRIYRYIDFLRKYLTNKEIFLIAKARHQIPLKQSGPLNQHIHDFLADFGDVEKTVQP